MKKTIKCLLLTVTAIFFSAGSINADIAYDTAWSFMYDGGKKKDGDPIPDLFHDIKSLDDGATLCVGESSDTTTPVAQMLLMKLDKNGVIEWKRLYSKSSRFGAYSLAVAKNGDFLVGGRYEGAPVIRACPKGTIFNKISD